jgi:Protein of unknown function (DUF1499)
MTDETATVEPTPPPPASPPAGKTWTWRIGVFALGGALLAVIVAFTAATAMRYDLVAKLAGFGWLFNSVLIALAAAVIGILALAVGLIRKSGPKRPALAAIGIVVVYLGIIASQVAPGLGAPMMHDVTTDIDDPPQFSAITLPADNLRGFETEADWQAAHRLGYPDMAPIIIENAPEVVLADARALAESKGWEVVDVNQQAGRLEAVAFASYVRFNDFVVVEVTPIADGSSRVDMRSTSEVGLGDIGYNAARISEFLTSLQAAN